LRARRLAGWRSAAGPGWAAGARSSEAGTRAKGGARTGSARGACTCVSASCARGMLGARTAGVLACSGRAAWGALRITARAATGPAAVEDWSAALNDASSGSSGGSRGRKGNHRGRGVDRPRTCLRHHHAPGGKRGRGRCVGVPLSAVGWRVNQRGSREIGGFSREHRFLLGSKGGHFGNQWGFNLGKFRCFCGLGFSVRLSGSLGCVSGGSGFRNCNRGFGRRLDHYGHCGRRHDDGRTLHDDCRSLGNHRFGWRARGNGGRLGDDGRRGARLGNNLARFRLGWRHGWRRDGDNRRRWTRRSLGGLRGRTPLRHTALPGLFFLFLFLGQDGLQHVAGLGNMR